MKTNIIAIPLVLLFVVIHTSFGQSNNDLFHGKFDLKKNPTIRGQFKLEQNNESYALMVGPTNDHLCRFDVKRITAPQQTRGMKGIIFSNKNKDCVYVTNNTNVDIFWNKIVLVDINYVLTEKDKINGQIHLSSITETFVGYFDTKRQDAGGN